MELAISASGHTLSDIADSVHEALQRFEAGNTSGFDFTVEGGPVENYVIRESGKENDAPAEDVEGTTCSVFDEAMAAAGQSVCGLRDDGDVLTFEAKS